jgi:hypothetical protein
MPKERIHKRGEGWADLLVIWDKHPDPIEKPFDQNVRLFIAAANENPGPSGAFYFHPDNPAEMGLDEGNAVGPVDIELDRAQVNYLIQVLRRARDQVYGRDE